MKVKMEKKGVMTGMVLTTIIAISMFAVLPMTISSEQASSNPDADIYVNTTGWWRPGGAFNESSNPIQDAINNATDGNTIFIYNGTYVVPPYGTSGIFRICLDKTLTLKGEGADVVTIDGNGGEFVIFVGHDGSGAVPAPGSVVEGFTIKNGSNGVVVSEKSPNCIIRDNALEDISEGIVLSFAKNCIIRDNVIKAENKAIDIPEESENTTCMGNVIDGGSDALGTVWIGAPNCTFISNIVTNTTGTYGAVYILNTSRFSTIANNTIINNEGAGILSQEGPPRGGNNIITGNNICSNKLAGFLFYNAAPGFKIYLNNIVDNGVTATTYGSTPPAVIYWNSTEPIEYVWNGTTYTGYLGNYWGSDYTGSDSNGDGIGDMPYTVPDNLGYDYNPLIATFENYPAPAAKPDLLVTAINAYHNNTDCDAWFNLSNEIDVTVKNNGTGAAEASNVSLYIDGVFFGKLRVPPLAAGASKTVTFKNWKPIGGDCLNPPCDFNWSYKEYNFTAVADCDGEVEESNETNNEMSVKDKACYNGYMADEPLENVAHGMLNGHIIFTTGDGVYASLYSVGSTQTIHYNVNLPDGATTKLALLYVYYTWCKPASGVEYACPEMEVNITTPGGTTYTLPLERAYNDTKCTCPYAYYNYPWGTYVYNVTEYITEDGTYTVTVKNVCTQCSYFCVAAPGLLILYEDTNAPLIEYWINEGADLLMGGRRYTTSSNLAWWECINNATFTASSETSEVANVTLGVVAPWGGEAWGEYTSYLFFNGIKLGTGVYHGYDNSYDETIDSITMHIGSTNAQVGVNVTDVTAYYMNGSDNVVGQADDGDNMMPAGAFLVVTYKIPTPPKPFVIYGWVNYSNGTAVLNPNVTITNLNTSEVFTATTSPDSNYYQVSTTSCNISAGDVLHFRVSDNLGNYAEFNHTVTQDEIDNGGFMQNITIAVPIVGICGDVTDDGIVNMGDVALLLNNVSYPGDPSYALNEWAGDVTGDGVLNMGDVALLLNNVSYPGDPSYNLNCR